MLKRQFVLVVLVLAICLPLFAQSEQYGAPITVDVAKRAAAAAIAEARKNSFTMAIAIVDPNGTLVYFEKMDNTQNASVVVAQNKAVSAAMYRRPTKAFQDALVAGGANLRILTLPYMNAVEGGMPLTHGGKIIGAIGASGGSPDQDSTVAAGGAVVMGR